MNPLSTRLKWVVEVNKTATELARVSEGILHDRLSRE